MAAWAAVLIGAGTSKSGMPMLRFTGSVSLAARSNTLRMPDTSMRRVRSASQWSCMKLVYASDKGGDRAVVVQAKVMERQGDRGDFISLSLSVSPSLCLSVLGFPAKQSPQPGRSIGHGVRLGDRDDAGRWSGGRGQWGQAAVRLHQNRAIDAGHAFTDRAIRPCLIAGALIARRAQPRTQGVSTAGCPGQAECQR